MLQEPAEFLKWRVHVSIFRDLILVSGEDKVGAFIETPVVGHAGNDHPRYAHFPAFRHGDGGAVGLGRRLVAPVQEFVVQVKKLLLRLVWYPLDFFITEIEGVVNPPVVGNPILGGSLA